MRASKARTETCALDVEVFWGEGNLIHSEHVWPARPYYLHSTPQSAPTPAFVVDPAWIVGVQHELISIEGETIVAHGPSADQRLHVGEQATVHLGPLQFRVRLVRPTQALEGAAIDVKRHLWTLASFSTHALALFCMTLMPPKAASLSLDLITQDERYVRYLATPIAMTQELPWTEDLGRHGAGQAQDDAQSQQGDEGQAGRPQVDRGEGRMSIRGHAQLRVPARSAAEQAKTAGILGILSAAQDAGPISIFGANIPLGYDPQAAQGALFGARVGENFGFNGLGMNGTGRHGGGDAGDTVGVGTLKTGEGARGAPGSLTLSHPRRAARVPKGLRIGAVETAGSLSKEVIRRVIQRHLNEVRFCYEQGLNQQPELAGRVAIRFMVNPAGAVQQAQVASSELNHPATEACIASAVRRWTFPAPDGGGYVTVSYPFLFDRPQS
jgi:TonB family protein